MFDLAVEFVHESWSILARMSPYLLLGFLLAGLLSSVFKPAYVRQHLGRGDFRQIVKASLFGVPLPLCSCGVLPVAAALRAHGASRGATLSFLTSTPQTGVDSIMITYGLLGPVFAVVRVVVAFLSGILCGLVIERFAPEPKAQEGVPDDESQQSTVLESPAERLKKSIRHGFVTIAGDIARPTLLGVLIAGAMTTLIPENIFLFVSQSPWLSLGAMLGVGVPLYVCSSGSVPLAYAFMALGISPGAVLVFLVVGPATNMATITTVWAQMGRRCVMLYLASLVLCAIAAGWGFDALLSMDLLRQPATDVHDHMHLTMFEHASAVVLLLIFAPKFVPMLNRAGA